jgi:hypothetical protein
LSCLMPEASLSCLTPEGVLVVRRRTGLACSTPQQNPCTSSQEVGIVSYDPYESSVKKNSRFVLRGARFRTLRIRTSSYDSRVLSTYSGEQGFVPHVSGLLRTTAVCCRLTRGSKVSCLTYQDFFVRQPCAVDLLGGARFRALRIRTSSYDSRVLSTCSGEQGFVPARRKGQGFVQNHQFVRFVR